jgi:L-alanine-DL-glutamate epimerase-like enolase superfamily enzyme
MSKTNAVHGIREARVRLFRIPVAPPRGDAIQKFSCLEIPFVEITDNAGTTGTGFGYTIGQGGTTIAELLRRELVDKLIGLDSRQVSEIGHTLRQSIHALTPGPIASNALAAIDVALWDLLAKRAGLPLHCLLGGAKREVPVYNTDVGWLDRPIGEMVALCREAVSSGGFRGVKLKVGKPDAEEDRERVAKVREAVGHQTPLMLDANQSWTIEEAIPRLKKLQPYAPLWIEEPLPATDIQGFRELGRHTAIPRAGGESLYSPAVFYEYLRQGALDILQPDVARLGGITPALEVCHLAQSANLRVAPHVSPELSLVVAAAVPNSFYIEYIPQMNPVLQHPLAVENGVAKPSAEPGHGIAFDKRKLEQFEVLHERRPEVRDRAGSPGSPRAA